ncbi:MAG: D-alanyl-D-alanine carboxypeptidase [bacterium]
MPELRFLRDPAKRESLAVLLEAPDLSAWTLRRRVLTWTNRHSSNRLANILLAKARADRPKVNPEALYGDWLDSLGVSSQGLVVVDGCGLSRRNRLTARTLTGLLVATRDARERELARSLAVPGRCGTLARRGLGLGHRVQAKTGYVGGVFTLAGYLAAESDTFAFAFLANDCPDPRAAYRLFTGLLLTAFHAETGTGAAEPPR